MTSAIRLLYVDDEPELLNIARIYFVEQRGFYIECVTSAKAALRRLEETAFDLIVSDYQMPEMNGIELLIKVRKKKDYIPFIIFTGRGGEEIAIDALNAGADFYFQKGGDTKVQFAEISHIAQKVVRQQRAEIALGESEERYRRITEGLTDYLYTVRVRHGMAVGTMHSAACFAVTGYTAEEFAADPYLWIRMVFPEDRNRVISHFSGVLSGDHVPPIEHRIVRKDGQVRWMRDTSVLQVDSIGNLVSYDGVIKDITERKLVEDALKERERSYRTLSENLIGIVYRIHVREKCHMQFFNNMLMTLTGYKEEELTQGTICSIDTLIVEKDRQRIMAEVNAAIKENRNFSVEYSIIHKDGTSRFFIERGQPVFDNDGLLSIDGIIHDMTDHKRTEEALHQANNKLTMLNSITRHDILNQLTVVLGYLKLSKDDVKDPVILKYILKEEQAAEAIQWQIEFTKNYQDIGTQASDWQILSATINSAIRQLKPQDIEINVAVNRVEVFSDPLMEKVFYNLMENSLRHGVSVTRMDFSFKETENGLILTYSDNGVGIITDDKNKLFKKGFGKHTGLGLFLSKEILAITGITITENGEPGKGVRFEILVPKGGYRFSRA